MDKVKGMITVNLVLTVLMIIALFIVGMVALNGRGTSSQIAVDGTQTINFDDIKVFAIDDALTNDIYSVDEDIKHTLRVKVTIGVNEKHKDYKDIAAVLGNPESTDQVKLIVSEINNIIRSKSYEEISRTDSKVILEEEVLKMLQLKFGSDAIVRADFWEYFHD